MPMTPKGEVPVEPQPVATTAADLEEDLERLVAERPLLALGVAFVTGMIAARLLF